MRTLPNTPGTTGGTDATGKSGATGGSGTPERGLTLALNAAENRLQITAVNAQGEMVFAQSWHTPSRGAEVLAPALEAALRLSGHTPSDITRIACVRGPGSFTGLRLALATTAGLARASGALTAGIDYLPLLALNVFAASGGFANAKHPGPDRLDADRLGPDRLWPDRLGPDRLCPDQLRTDRLWIVTHARRGLVHAQAFALELPAGRATGARGAGGPADTSGARGADGSADTGNARGAGGPAGTSGAGGAVGPADTGNARGADGSADTNGAGGAVGTGGARGAFPGTADMPPYILGSASFASIRAAIRPLTGLLVLRIHDDAPENRLAAHIAALGGKGSVLLAGSGVTRNRNELESSLTESGILCRMAESGIRCRMAGPACDHPSLETLCGASLEAEYGTEGIHPLYARPCDAEENLPRIAEKLGLDPEDARKKLDALTRGEKFLQN